MLINISSLYFSEKNSIMVGSRVFLGGLNYRVSEWDIENFFKGFSGVGDVTLKNGYAFVVGISGVNFFSYIRSLLHLIYKC